MRMVLSGLEHASDREIYLLARSHLKENLIRHLKRNCFVQSLAIKLATLKMLHLRQDRHLMGSLSIKNSLQGLLKTGKLKQLKNLCLTKLKLSSTEALMN